MRERCSVSRRASGLSAPVGSPSMWASSSSSWPGMIGAEVRLVLGQEALVGRLERLGALALGVGQELLEVLANLQGALAHPRARVRVGAVVVPALHAVVRDPRLQRLGRRRVGEVDAATPDEADVLRNDVGEGVDVVLPGPVEVALEEQVAVLELLALGRIDVRHLVHDRPAHEVDEVELQDVLLGQRHVLAQPEARAQDRLPAAADGREQRQARHPADDVAGRLLRRGPGAALDAGLDLRAHQRRPQISRPSAARRACPGLPKRS
jgi:hypothetical protein